MSKNSKNNLNRNRSYNEFVLKEEQQARRDFFNDDDIEDELATHQNENSVYRSEKRVKAKVGSLRETMNARRQAEEKLPEINDAADISIKAKTGRRKSSFVLGIVIIVFALIGFCNVIYWIGSGVVAIIKDDSRLRKYDDVIAPVVYFDPLPFETWQGADGQTLVYISVWETISGENDSKYEMNDSGRTVIPANDVNSTAKRIFGPDVVLDYSLFTDEETEIYYNSETDNIEVLSTGVEGFEHTVLNIDKSKGTVTAIVGYIEPDLYGEDSKDKALESYSKKMIYILNKDKETDKYYVASVREYTEE